MGYKIRTIFLVTVLFASTIFSGCQTQQTPVDDAAITTAVKAKLSAQFGPGEAKQEQQLERGADQETISHMSVQSVNGVVTLTGEVKTEQARAKAGEIAKSVEHVVSVNNNLAVAAQ